MERGILEFMDNTEYNIIDKLCSPEGMKKEERDHYVELSESQLGLMFHDKEIDFPTLIKYYIQKYEEYRNFITYEKDWIKRNYTFSTNTQKNRILR